MNFQELKQEILQRAKNADACSGQYRRAENAQNIDELIEVIKDNLSFVNNNDILPKELIEQFEKPELFGTGKGNVGLFNIGDLNIGDRNSGNRNIGDRNSGDRNSGDRNSGDRNSGDLNSGDLNSGDLNSGDLNSGDLNSGDLNSGNRNSGDRNSGDLNSGYRNSGVFCNRKREDTVLLFNRESDMTWDEWYEHRAYDLSLRLTITEWIDWDIMTDEEKKEYPKAFVTSGYLKVYDYKTAWKNLWETFNDDDKEVFKSLPNFDSEVFEDITGIKV